MCADRARLLSWLVDASYFAVCVVVIWSFVASIDLDFHHETFLSRVSELPFTEILSVLTLVVLSKPLPESLQGPYQYLPNAEWIRLAKIHHASDGGIDVLLQKFRLKDAPPYHALSYTWGPAEGVPEDTETTWILLMVSGHERALPKILVRALIQIRDLELDGYYWIDALSINQLDDEERSAQVNIMDKIHRRAEAVDMAR